MTRKLPILLIIAVLLGLAGCATTGTKPSDPRDPWEHMNRAIYHFNDRFYYYIFNPVARGYQYITPEWLDIGITNFFDNLGDIPNALNDLMQGKPLASLSDLGRVAINSTIGLLGFIDVASPLGLKHHNEDFGQTLAVWGVPSGNYLVLPILGASSVRDGLGLVVDYQTEPYNYVKDGNTYYALLMLNAIDIRADTLAASHILEQASFDPYTFYRETYFQHRRNLIYDGHPPMKAPSAEELDILDDSDLEITPPPKSK